MTITKSKLLFMSILNVTPDSFSDGGKYLNIEDAIKHADELIKSGVDIIDIGGESTRPGAVLISEEEELKRVIPVIYELTKNVSASRRNSEPAKEILISIDTYKSNVAQLAINAGAKIINDVSGLTMDPDMVNVAAKNNCPIVIMHNEGIPATKPEPVVRRTGESANWRKRDEVIQQIYAWLKKQTNYAIKNGVKKENIIIDPGLGFGKTPEEDFYIIQNLSEFKSLGYPILIGPSHKSFIRKLFPDSDIKAKSKEIIDLAIKNGANIVRMHEIN